MKKVVEDHHILKGYVDFVGNQYHKAIDEEQQVHDKQVFVCGLVCVKKTQFTPFSQRLVEISLLES